MNKGKMTFNLFVLTLISGVSIVFAPLALNAFSILLWSKFDLPNGLSKAIVAHSMSVVVAIAALNTVMTCLAWRWEGQGDPKKGVKGLGFLLLGEFLILGLLPMVLIQIASN